MLESIFGGLTNSIATLLDNVVTGLLGLLSFDMEKVLSYMPVIQTFYTIFQWVALGLIAGIATFQLGKFFFGNLSNSKDSPVQILARSAIAAGLVYVGNYVLQMLFDLFSYPMAAMLEVEVSAGLSFSALGGASVIYALGGLSGILLGLLIILLLAWNIMKILLEAIERWLMLCALTYTSPLAYATVASQATHVIFSKWFSMVLGQCILLLANIWSVKIILSIVAVVPAQDTIGEMCFCCLMVIAFTRIAQRMDTYLQRLGIGAATTGRSMLDTIAGVGGGLLSSLGGGSHKSGVASRILGAWGKGMADSVTSGNVIKGATLGGGIGALAAKAGKNIRQGAHASGMSAGEYVRSKVGSAASGIYDRATDAMGSVSPHGAETMRQAKDTLSAAVHGGAPARETAQSAGMTAMEKALREGRTPEEAKAAGLAAFDRALKDNAPLGEKTGNLFANTAKSMDAREAFEAELDPAIEKMQNGASRMYIDNNGVVHNGFGEVQPNAVGITGANGTTDTDASTQPGDAFDPTRLSNEPLTSDAEQTDGKTDPTNNATNSGNELDPNAEALRKAMQSRMDTNGEKDSPSPASDPNSPYVKAMAEQEAKTMGADSSTAGRAEPPKTTSADDKATPSDSKTHSNDTATSKPPVTAIPGKNPYTDAMTGQEAKTMGADSSTAGRAEPPKATPTDDKAASSDSKTHSNDAATSKPPVTAIPGKNPYADAMTGQEAKTIGADSLTAGRAEPPKATPTDDKATSSDSKGNSNHDTASKPPITAIPHKNPYEETAVGQETRPMGAESPICDSPEKQPVMPSDADTSAENSDNASVTAVNGSHSSAASTPTQTAATDSAETEELTSSVKADNPQTESDKIPTTPSYPDSTPSTAGSVIGADTTGNGSVTKEVNSSATSTTAASTATNEKPPVASPSASSASRLPTAASVEPKTGTATAETRSSSSVMGSMGESSAVKTSVPTMQGPNAMVSRTIAASANTKAAEAGTGFSVTVRNPDPAAFDENGAVKPGYSAEVISPGSQLAVNTINERGADVADDIISSEYVVDNQAVAAAAFKNSSFAEGLNYSDVSESFAAMDESGTIPAAREAVPEQGIEAAPDCGSISDMTVGKGVAEFTYTAPAQQKAVETVSDGETVQTFETVTAPVERISVRTAEAFSALPVQEQAQYRANQTASGQVFYTKRVRTEADSFTVAPEHRIKDSGKPSAAGSPYRSQGGSVPPKRKESGWEPKPMQTTGGSKLQTKPDSRPQREQPSASPKKAHTGNKGGRKSNSKRKK